MVLSDRTIREELDKGRIRINPLEPSCIQPASVDLHLDNKVLLFRNGERPYIDIRKPQEDLMQPTEIVGDVPFILHPGEFVLASTLEYIEVPDDIVARLDGKSSLGRMGLIIHSTAGYVDPGWKGKSYPGADKRGPSADYTVLQHEDWADIISAPDGPRRASLWLSRVGQQVPGSAGADSKPFLRGEWGLEAGGGCGTRTSPLQAEAGALYQ